MIFLLTILILLVTIAVGATIAAWLFRSRYKQAQSEVAHLQHLENARTEKENARAEKANQACPVIETLVSKVILLTGEKPSHWSSWGQYKSNGGQTAFEFKDDDHNDTKICRLRLSRDGTLESLTTHGTQKDEDDTYRYIKEAVAITNEQKARLKRAYNALLSERLIRMIDRIIEF